MRNSNDGYFVRPRPPVPTRDHVQFRVAFSNYFDAHVCTRIHIPWIDTSSVVTRTNYPQSVSHYDCVALRSRCSQHVRYSSALYVIGKRVLLFLPMLLFSLCSTGHRGITGRLPGLNIFPRNFARCVPCPFPRRFSMHRRLGMQSLGCDMELR